MAQKDLIINIGANTDALDRALKTSQGALAVFGVSLAALSSGALASYASFKKFETGFTDVVTLLDQSSFKTVSFENGIENLKKGLLDLRASTGQSFEELNKGLFDLISAGVDAEKAIEALKVSTDLALAGATQTSVAVDGLTSAMNAYGDESGSAQDVAEKFFTAQKGGKTTIEELSDGFGLAGATAASFGVSLDELLAATAAVTTGGIQTNAAYTGLNAVFSNIVKPTKDAAEEAQRLGIAFDSTALRSKGLKGFLDEITQSANFNDTSLEKLFGSVEALKVAQSLTGAQAEKFGEILGQLGDKTLIAANFQAALEAKQLTGDQAMEKLSGSVESLSVKMGEQFAPGIAKAANSLSKFTQDLSENEEGIRLIGAAVNALFSFILGSASFIIKQIGAVGKGFYDVGVIFNGVAEIISQSINYLIGKFDEFAAAALRSIASVIEQAQKLADVLPYVENSFQGSIEGINAKADEYEAAAKERSDKANAFFSDAQTEKLDSLKENLEAQQVAEEDHQDQLTALDEERFQNKQDIEQERRDEEVALKEEQDQEDIDRAQVKIDRLAAQQEKDLQRKLKAEEKIRIKEIKDHEKSVKDYEAGEKRRVDSSLSAAQAIFDQTTAVGKAIFIAQKARQVVQIINSGREAAALARATIPPPANEAAAARELIFSGVQAAAVAASAFTAQTGGKVPGAATGDKPFGFLEGGEIIVPSKLAPTFEQMFGNFPRSSASGRQNVVDRRIEVMIGLDHDASQILSVKQYEDRRLGISR